MDDGLSHLPLPIPIRVWLPCSPDDLAMGLRHWFDVLGHRPALDRVLHGRDVRNLAHQAGRAR